MENTEDKVLQGKVEVLNYLMRVAQDTQGAEVWRALFAEMRRSLLKEPE